MLETTDNGGSAAASRRPGAIPDGPARPAAAFGGRHWQDRFLGAADAVELAELVHAAIDELLPPGSLPQETRAEITQLFLAHLARAPSFPRARDKAVKALAPLAQLGGLLRRGLAPAPDSAEMAAAEPVEMPAGYREKFERVFSESLRQFIRERLEPFRVPEEGKAALPFLFSPTFQETFIQALDEHMAPTMLSARRISILAQTIAFERLTPEVFQEQFLLPERNNIVLYLWDDRWTNYQSILAKGRAGRAGGKGGKEEKGGLFGLFGKKDKKKVVAPATPQEALAMHAEGLWEMLRANAGPDTYEAPRLPDFAVFKALFRYDPKQIRDGQSGARQMLAQESGGGDGREGSSRQYLCKLVRALPPHCGELIALWAYFVAGKDFSMKILKGFQTSYGGSRDEQEKAVPFFTRWTPKG